MNAQRALLACGLVLALGVPVGLVVHKERVLRDGATVLLRLAPRDPRSLMQGDFMQLNYRLPTEVARELGGLLGSDRPRVVARGDDPSAFFG